jgi:hypothetical protein
VFNELREDSKLSLPLRRQFFEFCQAENRAIKADKLTADITAAALADAALHAHLQCGDYLLICETKFLQRLEYKLDHDGRSADHRNLPFR